MKCRQPNCGCGATSFIWVCHERRLVWYEVPKAGSSSIKKALGIVSPLSDQNSGFVNVDMSFDQAADEFKDFRSFAVIRNPWDKMISNYFMFCKSNNEFRNTQIKLLFELEDHSVNFTTFLELASSIPNHHWAQNIDFLPTDPMSNRAIDCIEEIGSIAKFFTTLSDYLGNELITDIINSTEHEHYSYYYDEYRKKIVEDMFVDDIETFGFVFQKL